VFALAGTHRIWFLHSLLFFLSMFWVSSRSFQSNASGARKNGKALDDLEVNFQCHQGFPILKNLTTMILDDFRP